MYLKLSYRTQKGKLFANFFFCYQTDTLLLCFQIIRFIYMSHLHLKLVFSFYPELNVLTMFQIENENLITVGQYDKMFKIWKKKIRIVF